MRADTGSGTRDRLVAAARAHLDEQGLAGLTLRAIARRAGVSHGAPLRHFPGVDHLLAAVAADGFRELYRYVAAATDDAGAGATALDRVVAAAHGYVGFGLANPGAFELMFRHERHAAQEPELLEAGAAAFLQLVALVAAAQQEGWRADAPTGELAGVVWAAVHGVVSLWLPGTLAGAVSLCGTEPDLDAVLALMVRVVTGDRARSRPARRAPRRSA
jgi:AcrR family transcriptional regulator